MLGDRIRGTPRSAPARLSSHSPLTAWSPCAPVAETVSETGFDQGEVILDKGIAFGKDAHKLPGLIPHQPAADVVVKHQPEWPRQRARRARSERCFGL
jgi:hypothetical protein